MSDVEQALEAGADKVTINTAAVRDPELIEKIAKTYGSQCVVASVQAKRTQNGWEAYTETGREKTGLQVLDWVRQLQDLGAGELLLTSVDQEGTKSGFDVALVEEVNKIISIPLIASGGYGNPSHLMELLERTRPSGLCFASVLHYRTSNIDEIKRIIQLQEQKESG